MTPEWITALCAMIALVGGGIWGGVTYFASKDYAHALNNNFKELKKEFEQLKDLVTTYISNEVYYRKHIEEQRQALEKSQVVMENVDGLFRDIDAKLKNGRLKVAN